MGAQNGARALQFLLCLLTTKHSKFYVFLGGRGFFDFDPESKAGKISKFHIFRAEVLFVPRFVSKLNGLDPLLTIQTSQHGMAYQLARTTTKIEKLWIFEKKT